MKQKSSLALYIIASVFMIITRLFQMIVMIDPETGFYREGFSSAEFILFGAWGVILFLIIVFGYLGDPPKDKMPEKAVPLGVASIFLSFAMGFYMYYYSATDRVINAMDFIFIACILASSLFFLIYGLALFGIFHMPVYLSVIPIVFCGLRLALVFIKYTGMAKISDNILDIGMLVSCLIFMLFHGKIISGIDFKHSVKWGYGIGLAASVICLLCTVPKYYIEFFAHDASIHSTTVPCFVDICLAIYILFFIVTSSRKTKEQIVQ